MHYLRAEPGEPALSSVAAGMITPLGWLERVPSYKEMQENLANKDRDPPTGSCYPVLMASDILALPQADFVPVGQGPSRRMWN